MSSFTRNLLATGNFQENLQLQKLPLQLSRQNPDLINVQMSNLFPQLVIQNRTRVHRYTFPGIWLRNRAQSEPAR